jgi:hypothetical protein
MVCRVVLCCRVEGMEMEMGDSRDREKNVGAEVCILHT